MSSPLERSNKADPNTIRPSNYTLNDSRYAMTSSFAFKLSTFPRSILLNTCPIQIPSQGLFTMTFHLTDKSKKFCQFRQKIYENAGKSQGLLFCRKFPQICRSNDVTWDAFCDVDIYSIYYFLFI